MSQVIEAVRQAPPLKHKLFQAGFQDSLAGEAMVHSANFLPSAPLSSEHAQVMVDHKRESMCCPMQAQELTIKGCTHNFIEHGNSCSLLLLARIHPLWPKTA